MGSWQLKVSRAATFERLRRGQAMRQDRRRPVMSQRLVRCFALSLAGALACPAYYHFVSYQDPCPPCTVVVRRFDVDALSDRTVRYYVQASGPERLAPGDSFASILSQLQLAAETWNQVPTARIRLAFGGLISKPGQHAGPAIDVLFEDIAPGLIALGGPVSVDQPVDRGEGPFLPIRRSVLILSRDLSNHPSGSEEFFLTLVHELGHALGLQHTLTSAVMSTAVTRGTTKARPLAPDDIAGLSALYPTAEFKRRTGTVTGSVWVGSQGVHLASVTVFSPDGIAISGLTRPDGRYEIRGVPPGTYYVYVQPLPPPLYGETTRANLIYPVGPTGQAWPPNPDFTPQFYPGVTSLAAAQPIRVERGRVTGEVNFFVQAGSEPVLYGVTTYGFVGSSATKPAFVARGGGRRVIVATGHGVLAQELSNGLGVAVVGGSAWIPPESVRAHPADSRYVQMEVLLNPFSTPGPRHLVFSKAGYVYLLPWAFHVTTQLPPQITDLSDVVTPTGQRAVRITGQRLAEASEVLFDGVRARVVEVTEDGSLVVVPPAAPAGHRATVAVLDKEGQSSLFWAGPSGTAYRVSEATEVEVSVVPRQVEAGATVTLEIRANRPYFEGSQVRVGFSTSDVVAHALWAVEPHRLLATVSVRPDATSQAVDLILWTGLDVKRLASALEVVPGSAHRPVVRLPLLDAATNEPRVYIGQQAWLEIAPAGLDVRPETSRVAIGDLAVPVLEVHDQRWLIKIPESLPAGPTLLRVEVAGVASESVIVELNEPPPVVLEVLHASGEQVTAEKPAHHGEVLWALVRNLVRPGATVGPTDVSVWIEGIEHGVHSIELVDGQDNLYRVGFSLKLTVPPSNAAELKVVAGSRYSESVSIAVAGP